MGTLISFTTMTSDFDFQLYISIIVATWLRIIFRILVYVSRLLDLRIGVLPTSASTSYARTLRVPSSKHSKRKIIAHVYEPPGYKKEQGPLPVLINFHGAGFVLPCLGSDAELCAYWAMTLKCIVLDSDYAKGPPYSFPAAVDDAMDVLDYVQSQPATFDLTKVTLGGFSSGANIAILSSLRMPKEHLDVKAVIAWYAPTNLARPKEAGTRGTIFTWIGNALRSTYFPPGLDRTSPEVSPLFADSSLFPPITLIVRGFLYSSWKAFVEVVDQVGSDDNLLSDSELLAKKLLDDRKDCVLHVVPGATHAWERFVKIGTPLWEARKEVLELVDKRLRAVFEK